MGTCTGVISSCGVSGYALESRYAPAFDFFKISVILTFRRCHLGRVILYDTVTKLGWSVHVGNHPIKVIIEHLLQEDWDQENGLEVPIVGDEEDCVVCPPCFLFWRSVV